MSDPRRPVHHPDQQDVQDYVRAVVYAHLMQATAAGAKEIGCSGASVVMIGMAIWANELQELDAKAAAKFLRSIATLYDPKSSESQKRAAEVKRLAAVKQLHAVVDLTMAKPDGHA